MTARPISRHAVEAWAAIDRLRDLVQMVESGPPPRTVGRPTKTERLARDIRRHGCRLPGPFGAWKTREPVEVEPEVEELVEVRIMPADKPGERADPNWKEIGEARSRENARRRMRPEEWFKP